MSARILWGVAGALYGVSIFLLLGIGFGIGDATLAYLLPLLLVIATIAALMGNVLGDRETASNQA